MDCANKNNYSVIRIIQEDVFYDTYDWLNELKQNINKIITDKKVQNIFMCKNNEYEPFNILPQNDDIIIIKGKKKQEDVDLDDSIKTW
jgi:hypothetical protein